MNKRVRLTKIERADILARQGGTCCVADCQETTNLIEEHSTPHTWTGAKADQLMCVGCHKIKTKRDIKAIAKARRISRGKTQFDKRAERGSRIRSRGFDKSKRKHMDGSVSER